MKFVYLDKRDRVRAWFNPTRSAALAGAALLFLALPIWHETTTGRFSLEPARRAVVRAMVAGTIRDVYIHEGQTVTEGTPLFKVTNIPLNSQLAHSQAAYALATNRLSAAGLTYQNLGLALQERDRSLAQTRVLEAQASNLQVASPLSGVVLTPSVEDKLGSYVTSGGELAEIGDLRFMRARLYISEYEFYKIRVGAPVRVQVDGAWRTWKTSALAIAPSSSEIESSLQLRNNYRGLNPPKFYLLDIILDNADNKLKPGMTGSAMAYGRRRSLGMLAWEAAANFFARKMW